ncbi:hypothetical protein [Comamonas odontotermitis]|uniref:hypothetical protein n=1 Tax=Comamonas odontotermitis TaxID=379895 RepID=UPI001CC7606F|nr:hypothetical protein [Comamonas odontotermitis]UBB15430.1 hypothetical protein LAD35_11145 [Comamonas odontotermitis]
MASNPPRSLIDSIPFDNYASPQAQAPVPDGLVARLFGAGQSNAAPRAPARSLIDAAFANEVEKATSPQVASGIRDLAGRSLASLAGAPVDVTAMAMAPMGYQHPAPVAGSEWIGKKLEDVGAISTERRPAAELLANLATPAALPKSLAMMAAMSPEGKTRLLADLTAGKGSGTYRLGDVTEGQAKGLSQLFGKEAPTRDVHMTDAATEHLLAGRINKDGFEPADVTKFAEMAMANRARPDLNVAKQAQNPSLLNSGVRDPVSGRTFDARMPLQQTESGYEVRTVVPEGLRARNDKTPKR